MRWKECYEMVPALTLCQALLLVLLLPRSPSTFFGLRVSEAAGVGFWGSLQDHAAPSYPLAARSLLKSSSLSRQSTSGRGFDVATSTAAPESKLLQGVVFPDEMAPQKFWTDSDLEQAYNFTYTRYLKPVIDKLDRGQPLRVVVLGSSVVATYAGCFSQLGMDWWLARSGKYKPHCDIPDKVDNRGFWRPAFVLLGCNTPCSPVL